MKALKELNELVEELAATCTYELCGFAKERIRKHILDTMNERCWKIKKVMITQRCTVMTWYSHHLSFPSFSFHQNEQGSLVSYFWTVEHVAKFRVNGNVTEKKLYKYMLSLFVFVFLQGDAQQKNHDSDDPNGKCNNE